MSWPFSSAPAPTFDTTPVDLPNVITALDAAQLWLLGAHFTNRTGATAVVLVTNTAGKIILELELPDGAEQPFEWAFRPALGLKWSCDTLGVTGHIWGYK